MSELRVFISSTCYDLSLLRAQLRSFIKSIGYEPVMSDFEDILYDPRNHTHTSCIDEVSNCDMLILIIGSRYGGKAKPEALSKVSFEALKSESANVESLKNEENLSVTQLEVLKAIESPNIRLLFSIMMCQQLYRSWIPMCGSTLMNPMKRNGVITIIHWLTTCGNTVF